MHLPALLKRTGRTGHIALRTVLAATGFRSTLPLLVAATVAALFFGDGKIDHIGPLTFQPSIPLILLVPLLLAVACATSHATWPSAVVMRSSRVLAARALSYVFSLSVSVVIVGLSSLTAEGGLALGTLRNLLMMSGVALLTTAAAGAAYAWLPLVVLTGAGVILFPPSDSPWSLYAWLFQVPPTTTQLWGSTAICALGLLAAAWDPRSPGYLRANSL